MEFIEITEEQREMLLGFLDIFERRCQYCGEITKDCCIMPPINTILKATITCNSPMCMSEYFGDIEEKNQKGQQADVEIYDECLPIPAEINTLIKVSIPPMMQEMFWRNKHVKQFITSSHEEVCPIFDEDCNNKIEYIPMFEDSELVNFENKTIIDGYIDWIYTEEIKSEPIFSRMKVNI